MVVGIIFIVISGTIFVSTAWQYLPVYVKQCILFLVSLCLFAGAKKLEKDNTMEKTEAALYYLAASFLGLFSLSVCGWQSYFYANWNAKSVLFASIVMFIPILVRFLKKRSSFDFTLTALLADWIVFWFILSTHCGLFVCCILSAAILTAYAIADFLQEKWIGTNKSVEQIFLVLYVIHAIEFVMHNIALSQIEEELTRKTGLWIMAACMVCITALSSSSKTRKLLLFLNSISIYWFVLTGVNFANTFFSAPGTYLWDEELVHFISFTLCAVCLICFSRKEMLFTTMIWGLLIPFVQLFHYGDYFLLFFHVEHTVSVYLPFSLVLIAAILIVLSKLCKNGTMSIEEAKPFFKAACMQVFVCLILFYASQYPFFTKGLWSILMLQNLTIAFLFKNMAAKIIFRCYALFYGEILAFICTADWIPIDFQVEHICLLIAGGVYLFGIICHNHGYGMRTFQFICICMIMIVLLCHGMYCDNVGNALFLGMTGLIMLVCAALFGSYRYMILSSVILVLMAFYITRSFWFSIQWWVYLFAAGIALVALAIKREKASKNI